MITIKQKQIILNVGCMGLVMSLDLNWSSGIIMIYTYTYKNE